MSPSILIVDDDPIFLSLATRILTPGRARGGGDGRGRSHVSRILTKMGARDRTQLVVMAYEQRLVAPGSSPQP
jgi:hypothetical protein